MNHLNTAHVVSPTGYDDKRNKTVMFFFHRIDVLSVKRSYVYDDGKERLKNDTFEREPYIVQFSSRLSSKFKITGVLSRPRAVSLTAKGK